MVFANQRVFYKCICGRRGEVRPTFLEIVIAKVVYYSGMPTIVIYESHVHKYTQRQLTYEYDILSAFTAVLNDFGKQFGTDVCWGLPQSDFTRALLWVKAKKHVSRPMVLQRKDLHPDNLAFPSWSWVGWVGGVSYKISFNILGER
jgi:hypothetical protein